MSNKALVVGINQYPPPNTLPSCVNDASTFSDLLSSTYGFDDITKLFDADAKQANIASALRELFDGAQPDDRLVFYYSGHGYTHKVENVIEEALVGQDLKFYNSSDLLATMQDLPAGILTIVLDSCFSGGIEKFIFLPGGKVEQVKMKRYVPIGTAERSKDIIEPGKPIAYVPFGFSNAPRPSTLVKQFILAPKKAGIPVQKGSFLSAQIIGLQDPGSRGLLLSACKSDETAAASTSDTNGLSAFTFCLLQSIDELGADSTSSDLLQRASQKLADLGVAQTPLLKEPIEPAHLGALTFVALEPRDVGSEEVDKDLLSAIERMLKDKLPGIIAELEKRAPRSQRLKKSIGPLGPFGDTFERLGDALINKVVDEIFGDSGAARQTLVIIYNHMDNDLFFVDSSFDSGGFTPGMQAPDQIEAKTAKAYKVESHGFGTGVTGARVYYGLDPNDPTAALEVVTSNPFVGDNHSSAQGFSGLNVVLRDSVGNFNQVDVDVRS